MAVVYSIRGWDDHFEVAQSRKVRRSLQWVGIPCKHDGKSFRRLMMLQDGPEIYGAWILIVQVAAKCPVRGILADEDGPLDSEDLHIKTGCPQAVFDKALAALSSKPIGWLVVEQWERSGSALPPHTDNTDRQYQPTNPPTPQKPETAGSTMAGGLAGGDCFASGSAAPAANSAAPAAITAAQADPPEAPASTDETPRPVRVSGWGAVRDRLAAMGASRWREATNEAKECGCDWQLALKLIDYGTSKGYGVGAIICRLAKARPTLPVDAGWPAEPTSAAETRKRAESAADRQLRERLEAEATHVIKAGRRAKKSDAEIEKALAAAGLEWPR